MLLHFFIKAFWSFADFYCKNYEKPEEIMKMCKKNCFEPLPKVSRVENFQFCSTWI